MPTSRSRLGSRGESLARGYLLDKGYDIMETNYRCQWGEVDIIARHGQCLVFVEVRTRRSAAYGSPEESVTRGKAQKLIATAQSYLEEHNMPGWEWRIDLVSVELDRRGRLAPLRHIQNAVEEAPSP